MSEKIYYNESPSYYSITPATVRYDEDLPANAKLLYGEITALCNKKGYCWATNDYFARLYKVSKKTISRWVSSLKNKGYISVNMKYREGSCEIEERQISLVPIEEIVTPMEENFNTYGQNCTETMDKNVPRPMDKKVKENTTLGNTTSNIKKDVGISKKRYGEYQHVLLTDTQYNKLKEDVPNLENWIRKVDEYCQIHGKTYKDYNLVIRNWYRDRNQKVTNQSYLNIGKSVPIDPIDYNNLEVLAEY